MDLNYNTFLETCISKGKIPMSFVRSEEFLKMLENTDIPKDMPYEELFYSRDEDLNVKFSREGVRYYHEDNSLFEKESETTSICKKNIDLGLGYEDYTFFSRAKFTHENVKGTKYVGLMDYERKRKKKVDADIVVSRHTLIDCLYLFFNKTRFSHYLVYSDGQVFFESSRNVNSTIDRATMTGYNFEELLTLKSEKSSGDFKFEPPKNNAVKYNSMIIHKFPSINTKVLVSCEIDAVLKHPEKLMKECANTYQFKRAILENYMELKTRSSSAVQKKTYLQCYLAGTKNLVIGVKDKDLILKKVVKYDLLDYESERILPVILNKWFAFIVQFITLTIKKYAKRYKKGLYKMVIFNNEDVLKIYPFNMKQEQKDIVIIPKFLTWRKELKQSHKKIMDEVNKYLLNLSISNSSKRGKRRNKHAKNQVTEDVNSSKLDASEPHTPLDPTMEIFHS